VNIKTRSLKALPLAVLLCISAGAKADVIVYTDRTAFLAALSLPGTDTFNDLTSTEMASPLNRMAGTYSYRVSAGPQSDFFPAGTAADRWLATNVAGDTMTFFNFASGVRGFGGNFFGSDVTGAFSPGHTMVLTASDGTTTRTVNLNNTTVDTFLGFISTTSPFSSVTLRNDGQSGTVYWATANNLTLAVPEPATYGMLLAGLGLFGFMVRRRTR
jgi:hypothetical protein